MAAGLLKATPQVRLQYCERFVWTGDSAWRKSTSPALAESVTVAQRQGRHSSVPKVPWLGRKEKVDLKAAIQVLGGSKRRRLLLDSP